RALGFHSRYVHDSARMPKASDAGFLRTMRDICGDSHPTILPVGIDTLLALCQNHAEVSEFASVALPPLESILLANDKASLMEFAARRSVPVPKTTTLVPGECNASLAARIGYPAVIKYRAGELLGLDPQNRYAIVKNASEFESVFEKMHALQEFPLVQEYISGDGFGVSAVFDRDSNPIRVFCHHRLREYPISGGPSCLCESAWDDTLVEYALKILKALNWVGVAMVEFKGNTLMEINPRIWGSFALAPIAGCDMALALHRAARGDLAEGVPAPDYKIGKKMRFFLQDMLSFPSYLRESEHKIKFSAGFVRDLLNPTIRDGVFSIKDTGSSFAYFRQALGKADKIIR
ncbi:MAG: ATP-grasp domain-containing protein, partial [Clostridia bacterium]